MELDDVNPNLRRAFKAKEYPVERTFRLKDAEMNAQFQILQKNNMESRCGKYSN